MLPWQSTFENKHRLGTGPVDSRVLQRKTNPSGLLGSERLPGGWASKKIVLLVSWRVSIHCHVPVLPPDQVPQVTVQPSSTVQKLGGTVILGCIVEPPWMNATWRLNGKELNGSDDALGILITRGTLVVTALSNHTVGRYQCVARMPAGAVASVPATVTLASECYSFALLPWRPLSGSFPFSLPPPGHSYPYSCHLSSYKRGPYNLKFQTREW